MRCLGVLAEERSPKFWKNYGQVRHLPDFRVGNFSGENVETWKIVRRRKLSADGGLEKRKGTGAQFGAPSSEESQYLVEVRVSEGEMELSGRQFKWETYQKKEQKEGNRDSQLKKVSRF